MKKKLFLFLFLLFQFTFLFGCQKISNTKSLLVYINDDMKNVIKYENIVRDSYTAVIGENYTNDDALYEALSNTVIPASDDLLNEAESVKCGFKELNDIHGIYVKYAKKQHEAFTILKSALEQQDPSLADDANELINESASYATEYLNKFQKLCTDNNVSIEN